MCIYIYIYIFVHTHIYIYICKSVWWTAALFNSLSVLFIQIHANAHVHTRFHTLTVTHTHSLTGNDSNTHTQAHTHIHTHIHLQAGQIQVIVKRALHSMKRALYSNNPPAVSFSLSLSLSLSFLLFLSSFLSLYCPPFLFLPLFLSVNFTHTPHTGASGQSQMGASCSGCAGAAGKRVANSVKTALHLSQRALSHTRALDSTQRALNSAKRAVDSTKRALYSMKRSSDLSLFHTKDYFFVAHLFVVYDTCYNTLQQVATHRQTPQHTAIWAAGHLHVRECVSSRGLFSYI